MKISFINLKKLKKTFYFTNYEIFSSPFALMFEIKILKNSKISM